MKARFFVIAAVASVAALSSCKQKDLPFFEGKLDDPAQFCKEAKALMPAPAIYDSLAYVLGTNLGVEVNYTGQVGLGDLDIERIVAGIKDFKKVDFDEFNQAAGVNFTDSLGQEVVKHFEISPAELSNVVSKVIRLRQPAEPDENGVVPEKEAVTAELTDSTSYMFGVLMGYRTNEFPEFPLDRFSKGYKDFRAADADREYIGFQTNGFQDEEYQAFKSKLEIAPEDIQDMMRRYSEAKNEAVKKNVEVLGKQFLSKAKNVKDMKEVPVKVEDESGEDKAGAEESNILYRYTKENAEGTPVEIGDSFTVHYKGQHVNGEIFDEGEFPVRDFTDETGLIKGFKEGLKLLKEGDEIELVIPGELAYGERGSYNPWTGIYSIYPNEVLVFTLSVSDIVKPQAEKAEPASDEILSADEELDEVAEEE